MIFEHTSVTETWTVRDVTRCFPMSIIVFHELGIDTCFDAIVTLEFAATKAGLTIAEIMKELGPCIEDDAPPCDVSAGRRERT